MDLTLISPAYFSKKVPLIRLRLQLIFKDLKALILLSKVFFKKTWTSVPS